MAFSDVWHRAKIQGSVEYLIEQINADKMLDEQASALMEALVQRRMRSIVGNINDVVGQITDAMNPKED